jgi:dTDP-4-dehydrorhamnose 3,5-epimerase
MRFVATALPGAFVVELEPHRDDRGFFARAFSDQEFADVGIEMRVRNANATYTARRGTIRGLHYQLDPGAEQKLIRCTRGGVFSVIVDLRPGSATYLEHLGVELTADNRRALYIPEMCAAGALSLTDDAETFYLVSAHHRPDLERGIRYDDPALGITWPIPVEIVSDKDRSWPDFEAAPKETS